MLEVLSSPDHVVAYKVHGTLDAQDYDRVVEAVESRLARHAHVGLYADMRQFSDMTAEALRKDLRYSFGKIREWDRFPRMALVTDKPWLKVLVSALDPVLPQVDARTFAPGEEAEAMQWASDLPSTRT